MSITAATPATTPLPVHRSEPEFTAGIFPHRSMPTRGPKGKLGDDRVLNLSLGVLYTGMQGKGWPVPQDRPGTPAIHDTTVSTVFAKGADEGSLWQAFIARVTPLSAEKHRDSSVLHGDGTNTVAPTGGMGWGMRGTHTSRANKSWRERTTMAMASLPSPWLPCMKRLGCSFPRA